MDYSVLGEEAREVLGLMLPSGDSLREFAASLSYEEGRVKLTTCWDLKEAALAHRKAKTRAGAMLLDIRRIAGRARRTDPQAILVLALLATEAAVQLKKTILKNPNDPTVRWLAMRMPMWPIVWSPVPGIRTTRKQIRDLDIGANLLWAAGTKPDITKEFTFFAVAAAFYMITVRLGTSHSPDEEWVGKVCGLDDLTPETAGQWWPHARKEINRSYPDLTSIIYRDKAPENRPTRQEAMRLIRERFLERAGTLL